MGPVLSVMLELRTKTGAANVRTRTTTKERTHQKYRSVLNLIRRHPYVISNLWSFLIEAFLTRVNKLETYSRNGLQALHLPDNHMSIPVLDSRPQGWIIDCRGSLIL